MCTKKIAWVLGLGLLLSACVSSKKYKALEQEHKDLRARLELSGAESENLAQTSQELKNANASLAQDSAALAADKTALLQERQRLADEKQALERQNAALLQAQRDSQAQFNDVLGQLKHEVDDGQLKLTQYKNMLNVNVAEKAFFNSGSDQLKPEGQKVLTKVGKALNQYPDKYIHVIGHTDDEPVQMSPFIDNWVLATARAGTVVRFLQKQAKVEGRRLEASGRSEYDPVASNATDAGKQENRRIEILLIDKALFESTQPSALGGVSPTVRAPGKAP